MTDSQRLDYHPAQLHCRVNTEARLPPDAVTRLLGAVFDVVALANVIVSPNIVVSQMPDARITDQPWLILGEPSDALLFRGYGANIRPLKSRKAPDGSLNRPPYFRSKLGSIEGPNGSYVPLAKAIPFARRRLQVDFASYRNPLITDVAMGSAKAAKGAAGFINSLLNGAAERRSVDALTEAQVIANTVMDATIDVSTDMRYEELESKALDNELKREELKQARLKTKRMQLQLAEDVLKLQAVFGSGKALNLGQAEELLDNDRLMNSVDFLSRLPSEFSVDEESEDEVR